MIRKAFKRNVQKQRHLRTVTYMQEQKAKRAETIKNGIGGAVLGLVLMFGFFYGADYANEKRNSAIGVGSTLASK